MRQHHHLGAAHDVRWDFREGGKTLSTGAAPPAHRCVADSAARRFGGREARRPSRGRRLVSSCDGPIPALPASIFLPISVPSALRRHVSCTWRGRWHLLGRGWGDPLTWRRTARLSFPTVAQWRHSGGQRLVSSCDGPVPALPARIFPLPARGWRPSDVTFPTRGAVAGPLATLRRHVSFTWCGRPAGAADGWSPHLRCGPSRRPYDSDEAVVAVEIQVNVRGDCAQLWQATHTIDDVHEGGGRRSPPPPLLCSGGHRRRGRWSAVARGARCFFGTPRCPATAPTESAEVVCHTSTRLRRVVADGSRPAPPRPYAEG